MASLKQRLQERKIVQWTVAYLAGAWALVEASSLVVEQFHWPEVVGQVVTVLAGFGFFVVLVLAWYHGEKGSQRLGRSELVILALLLVAAGITLSKLRQDIPPQVSSDPAPLPIRDERPSVAALPFTNLSSQDEDAYLAPGIHEEVIAQLSKIGGLRVVSRTSVMRFGEPGSDIRQIARDLGVASVLEGTVQKVLNRVRVNVQLIGASRDEHLWSATFDREITLENLLDIQAEVAKRIAEALQTELTDEENSLVGARLTHHLDAYQAYLRGRYFQRLPHYSEGDVVRASREFEKAVELDPTFALAWMELANSHAQEVYYWTDASPRRRELARAAAEQAMNLDPSAPEVQLALGLYHLWLDRDAERALEEIARAERGLPNAQRVYEARAGVYEMLGRYDDAVAEYRRALNLSPGDASVLTLMAWDLWTLRRYDEAEARSQEAINFAPDQMWPNLIKVLTIWSARGPTQETREILEGLSPMPDWVVWARYWQRMLEDRPEEALAVLSDPDLDWIRVKMWARPKPLLEAFAYRAMGRTEAARRSFAEAASILRAEVESAPDDPRYHSSLALALAGLGSNEEAVRQIELAMSLLPTSEDAYYGLPFVWDLSAVQTLVGDYESAVDAIEHLLQVPSWVSEAWLEHDFRIDPLRSNPDFQALLEALARS